jgi:hypothetical protein
MMEHKSMIGGRNGAGAREKICNHPAPGRNLDT